MNNRRIIIILLIFAITVGLVFSIFLTYSMYNKEEEPKDITQETQDTQGTHQPTSTPLPTVKPDIPVDKPKEPVGDINENSGTDNGKNPGEYQVQDNESGEELSLAQSKVVEAQAREAFRNYDFKEGAKIIREATNTYKFTENGNKLESLYYEASLITNIEGASIQGVRDIIANITDAELLLLTVLSSPTYIRAEMVLSEESIFPIFEGEAKIVAQEEEAGNKLERVRVLYPATHSLSRFEIEVEGKSLYAYIIQYPDGFVALHSMEEVEPGTSGYYTLQRYKEILQR